jgi:hypothetical protein
MSFKFSGEAAINNSIATTFLEEIRHQPRRSFNDSHFHILLMIMIKKKDRRGRERWRVANMEKETESTKLVLSKFLLSIYREKRKKGRSWGNARCL